MGLFIAKSVVCGDAARGQDRIRKLANTLEAT